MKDGKTFLIFGILLSVISKVLQFFFHSSIGDFLVLIAALFFVLAILLYLPFFRSALENKRKKNMGILFGGTCWGTVLCFQLLTMFVFGRGSHAGYWFILPLILCICVSYLLFLKLKQNEGE